MNGNIITLLILKYWKICLSIYMRYSIGITRNETKIHRSIPCIPRSHIDGGEIEWAPQTLQPPLDSGAAIEHYEEWILCRWSRQVKRYMTFLMYDHCSPSIVRSKPFVQIQGRFETSPRICLSDPRFSQWSHLLEYFSGVARENDTTFFTYKNLCFPIETIYPLNLCRSSQRWYSISSPATVPFF